MMTQAKKRMYLVLFVLVLGISPSVFAQSDKFEGAPVIAEGADLGYYVWKEGETWHVRWTTMGKMRSFTGSVDSTGGKLKSLKRIDVEKERKVLYPGRAPSVWVGPRGRIHSRGGRAPVVVEKTQDKIDKDGDYRIVFSALTNNDIDGFDFKLDKGVTLLRLILDIDGRSMPQRVAIGKNGLKAPTLPLEVHIP